MNPTIKDVAREAGVSVATVSRVLNNLPGYTEETRRRVLKVIKELGYQSNALARGLVCKRSHTIGILMPSLSSMVTSEMLKGIERQAHNNEKSVIVCNTDNDGIRTLEYLDVLKEKQVDGIIVVSANLTPVQYRKLVQFKKPVVLVSTCYAGGTLPYVKVDDEAAAYDATLYLLKKGHRRIGMLSGTKEDRIAGFPRIQGYKRALAEYGVTLGEEFIAYGDFTFRSGIKAMAQLLETASGMTAVFAASDEMAAGALVCAYKRGIKVPDDLSIIGYDNTQIAEMTIPPLTTLSQPFYHMGELGMMMLIDNIEQGKKMESRILPHTIQERETVKELFQK